MKYLFERMRLHNILFLACLIGGICFLVSSLSLNFLNLVITMFLGAACCCIINVTCNVCTMHIYKGDGQDYWIQLLHTIFGLGGLIGPFLVAVAGAKSYFVLGLLLALSSFLYIILEGPDNTPKARATEIAKPISTKV